MPGDDDIDINATLHDAVSRPAHDAEDALNDLEDQALKTSVAMKALADETDNAADQERQLARDAKKAKRAQDQQARAAKQGRDEMGRFTQNTKKSRFELKSFLKVGFGFSKFFKVSKIFAVADGATQLAGGLSAVAAGGVAAVAGLAPLTGTLVAYPGLMAAGAQGLGAFKLGVKGVGAAITALADPKADPKELAKALKDLTPEARKFAVEVAGLAKQGKKMQQNIQQKLFAGLSKEIRPLAKAYLPILNQQLGDTAHSLNLVGKYTAAWLKQKSTQQDVNQIMGQQDILVRNLGMGLSDLARFFVYVLKAAQPFLAELTVDFKNGLNYLANWGSKNGKKMSSFFSNSYLLLRQVIGVLVDFGAGLYNIFKLSTPLAGDMGKALHDIAANFRAWTESAKGQEKIRAFFAYAKPVLWEIGKLIWAVVQAFGQLSMSPNLVNSLKTIRTDVLPMIVQFGKASDGQFVPSILEIIKALGSLAGSLNIITPMSVIIRAIADALQWLSVQVAGMSEGQRQFLAWAITASLFFTKFKIGFDVIKTFLPEGFGLGTVLQWIGKGLLFVGRALLALVIANPVVAVIVLIIAALVIMYFKFAWFRNFVNAVWHGIASVAIAVWNAIKNAVAVFWGWVGPFVMAGIGLVVSYFKLVFAVWRAVWYAIRLVVLLIVAAIVIWVRTQIEAIKATFHLISDAWKIVWDKIKPIVQPVLDWAKRQFDNFIKGVKIVLPVIADNFRTVFNKVKSIVMPIIDGIKGAIDKITEAVGKIGDGLKGAGDKVGGFISKVVPGLATGGPLSAGTTALVGEQGPEAFVTNTGNVKMIGANGPEFMKPSSSGYVVPNGSLDGSPASTVPSWATSAVRRSMTSGMQAEAPRTASRGAESGAPESLPPVNFNNNTFTSNVDVKKAIKQAWREHELEKERK